MNDAAPGREAIRVRFLKVDTSNVADVLDDMGFPHQGLAADFKPFPESAGKLAGWAYTIRGQMTPYAGKGDPEKMKACQGLAPGDVSVWSGDGEGICYFGELIAVGMKDRGSVGALVDGVFVISAGSERSDFPYTPDIEHLCNRSGAGKSSSGSKTFTCEGQRRNGSSSRREISFSRTKMERSLFHKRW
jgi:regulator of RNase E activity RraA